MGKKAKLYVVVLINLLAWGYVGYKVYGALQGDDDITLTPGNTPVKKITDTEKEELLTLKLNYPDPFLKTGNFASTGAAKSAPSFSGQPSGSRPSKPSAVPPKVTHTVTPAAAPALNIRYLGLLKNNDRGIQTAMLNVNERSVFAKQNDVIEGYMLTEVTKDFVRLKKGKEILTISK